MNKINQSSISLMQKQQQTIESSNLHYFDQQSPNRLPLEQLIYQVYKKHYGIELTHFYPNLISIETTKKQIKAVAGIRCAAEELLFSEYYLKDHLETTLKQCYGKEINRDVVVEVGNLAPSSVGQMRWLITSITAFLHGAGFKYIVFTLAPMVYNAFKRMGLHLNILAEAKRECLPKSIKQEWNEQYYQLSPKVLTGDISYGFPLMKENIYQSNQRLIPLFEQAYQLGLKVKQEQVKLGQIA